MFNFFVYTNEKAVINEDTKHLRKIRKSANIAKRLIADIIYGMQVIQYGVIYFLSHHC